jgi:hypothetical protein
MPPTFPNTSVKSVTWSNYSGTLRSRSIPVFCTPQGGTTVGMLREHGDAVRAILRHCFDEDPPLTFRAIGSTWSFSRIVEPGSVVIDPANMNFIQPLPQALYTDGYRPRAAGGFTPMFIEAGTLISDINRRLGTDVGLALQTSGAGDGHRVAGCIATGTHGSALRIGAVHDTVLGVYLVVSPDRALFIQSGTSPFVTDAIAPWLQGQTGIPTENFANDAAFHAAQVALGSLGFVFAVVVETVPLYRMRYVRVPKPWNDPAVWRAIRTLDTTPFHPTGIVQTPDHFDIVMHPYPPGGSDPGALLTVMWKTRANMPPMASPLPAIPRASSDIMGMIAGLADILGNALTAPIALPYLRGLIAEQIDLVSTNGEQFPGQMFGPTSLPPGTGASTEIIVNQGDAERALQIIYDILRERATDGDFLLGAIGVRFVPETKAHLGMNIHPMNCYIELPSIRNDTVLSIYREVWDTLEARGIVYTCHWGQLHGMNPTRLRAYFGDRVDAWKEARHVLLDDTARRVFAAPILAEVGLDD